MNNLLKKLREAGFSEKKAKIYLTILKTGEISASDIAKISKIKRTTAYNLLPELLEEGIVKQGIRNKKKVFYVENPESIEKKYEKRLDLIKTLLPEIKSLQNYKTLRPKITFYEGEDAITGLYDSILDNSYSGDTIFSFTGLKNFHNLVQPEFSQNYIKKRLKKKIKTQIVATDSIEAEKWKKNASKELREIKIINENNLNFNADIEIYGKKVAIISFDENFIGAIIESEEINKMMRFAFSIIWNSLP